MAQPSHREGILGHPELSKAFRASISNTLATTVIVREFFSILRTYEIYVVAQNIEKNPLRSAQQFRPVFKLSSDRDGQVMTEMMMLMMMMVMVINPGKDRNW